MNFSVTPKSTPPGAFLSITKLIAATIVFVSTFLVAEPLSASASPAVWTNSEVASSLNVGNNAYVDSVSCTSSTSCVAGGQFKDGSGNYQAFVSVYNGSAWADHEVAGLLNVGNYAYVNSVSCASSTSCVAGGGYRDGSGHEQAFVSVYNGSAWADHELAGLLNVGNNAYVKSVSCASSTSCVAGGDYRDGSGHEQAFVSVYNGSAWADQEVPGSLNVGNAVVYTVSCASSTSCVAGGDYTDSSGHEQAFVSVYNGSTWADHEVAGSLNVGNIAYVDSVSCASSTSCVAGGGYKDGSGNYQAFVSVYNGSAWADHELAGSLNVGNAHLSSVICDSSTSCVAGGQYTDSSGHEQAFVSVYNGSAWADHEVAGSLNVGNNAYVSSVSCTSSTSCVAGGQFKDGSGNYQAFVSVYNGSAWADQEVAGSLNVGNGASVYTVSCASSTSCVVGGTYSDAESNSQAFVSTTTLPVTHARVSGTVYFASGSSSLTVSAKHTLNTLATQIVSQSQSSVTLNGYTDPRGAASTNLRLSTQRANSVKFYLKSKLRSLGDTGVTFVLHGRGVTHSGSSYAHDRKVTLS